jgi:MFS family permease
VGRIVQGAGVTIVPIYVIIARCYPERLRAKIFAATAAAWVVPSLIGPTAAGLIAEHLNWRLVFLGLIPLVVPAALMLLPVLRYAGGAEPDRRPGAGRRTLAAVAMAGGAGALLYAAGHVAASAVIVVLALAGLAGLGLGLPRLLPSGTLRLGRGLPATVALRGLLAGAFIGMESFIPLAFTSLHGFTPTAAGLVLTAGALGWSAASWYQARGNRSQTRMALAGALFVAGGVIGSALAVQGPGLLIVPTWIATGIGMGLAYPAVSVLVLGYSPPAEQGGNSAALQIVETLGGSLVVGLAGAIIAGFGPSLLGAGMAVSGLLTAVIAAIGVVAGSRVGRVGRVGDSGPVKEQS